VLRLHKNGKSCNARFPGLKKRKCASVLTEATDLLGYHSLGATADELSAEVVRSKEALDKARQETTQLQKLTRVRG